MLIKISLNNLSIKSKPPIVELRGRSHCSLSVPVDLQTIKIDMASRIQTIVLQTKTIGKFALRSNVRPVLDSGCSR